MNEELETIAVGIIQKLDFDNYVYDDGSYWTANEVLWNKIQWIKEEVGEESEHFDTLELLEQVLQLVDIDKLANV